MNNLLLVAAVALLMTACDQQPENVSSYPTNTDSSAIATASSAEEKEERNKRIALESVKAVAKGNVDSILKDVTPDAVDYGDGTGPVFKHTDSLKLFMKALIASFPDYKGDDFMAAADGDYVYVFGEWSGTFKNDYMGMKATGKSFKAKDVDIFKFNDNGQIVEHKSVQQWSSILAQVGANPSKK